MSTLELIGKTCNNLRMETDLVQIRGHLGGLYALVGVELASGDSASAYAMYQHLACLSSTLFPFYETISALMIVLDAVRIARKQTEDEWDKWEADCEADRKATQEARDRRHREEMDDVFKYGRDTY